MKKLRSQVRKVNLLYALELLDEMVRHSAIVYAGTTTQQAVTEAIQRAKRRSMRTGMAPRDDQLLLVRIPD